MYSKTTLLHMISRVSIFSQKMEKNNTFTAGKAKLVFLLLTFPYRPVKEMYILTEELTDELKRTI